MIMVITIMVIPIIILVIFSTMLIIIVVILGDSDKTIEFHLHSPMPSTPRLTLIAVVTTSNISVVSCNSTPKYTYSYYSTPLSLSATP